MIPRSVYIAIGIVLLLLGIYQYGHHAGWEERDQEMQSEIARKNAESRQKEQELTEKLTTQSVQLKEANNVLDQKQSALDRAIRAGRVRISTPASCVQASPGAPAPAGDSPEAPSESERQTLAAIAALVAEGDRAINQLNACIDAYNKVTEAVNGQR
jgi:hypothetical protein